MSHMRDEIGEQPQAIQRLIDLESAHIAATAAALRAKSPAVILIAARGTSDNAAGYAKYLFGLVNHTVVALAAPSLTTLYDAELNLAHAAVIGISQSGESTDVLEVMQAARRAGALTIGVTNGEGSALAAGVDHAILLHAGREQALPATKTYTAQLAAMALLSAHLAGDEQLLRAAGDLPEKMQAMLAIEHVVAEAANRYRNAVRCVCLARGINYATALEAALKLKETCYLGAEPYSSADFMHGPIAVVERGFPCLLFAPPGRAHAAMVEMADALTQRGAATMIVARGAEVLHKAVTPVAVPVEVDELLSPIPYIVPAQFFALHLAQAKRLDPDAPRGLHKVTLTR